MINSVRYNRLPRRKNQYLRTTYARYSVLTVLVMLGHKLSGVSTINLPVSHQYGLAERKIFSYDNPERKCRTSSRRGRVILRRYVSNTNTTEGEFCQWGPFLSTCCRSHVPESATANRPAPVSRVP
jgi:hypothetical protein